MMTFGKPARFQLLTLSAVVINALLMIASARAQLYEGDPCTLKDGASGICTKATECSWFVPRKTERKHCSWSEDRLTEVICCKTPEPIGVRSSLACQQQDPHVHFAFHIIEGEEAEAGEFPFMAALGYHSADEDNGTAGYDFRCGASLITERFLLTAAHCVKKGQPLPLVALLGTVKLGTSEGVLVMIKLAIRAPKKTELLARARCPPSVPGSSRTSSRRSASATGSRAASTARWRSSAATARSRSGRGRRWLAIVFRPLKTD